jgi:hypothetical protein
LVVGGKAETLGCYGGTSGVTGRCWFAPPASGRSLPGLLAIQIGYCRH